MHATLGLHGETDILFNAEVWKQIGELERAAKAGAGSQRRGKLRYIFTFEQDAASAWPQLSGDQVEIGGLASPVGADNGGQLARPKAAADMIDLAPVAGRGVAKPSRVKDEDEEEGQRLLRIGTDMSSILSSRTGSSTAQLTFGSTLTLK